MQGGMERMFNKCVTQCRRLRNLNMAGVQGVLVLAGTRNQSLDEDFALHTRARQIWAKNSMKGGGHEPSFLTRKTFGV